MSIKLVVHGIGSGKCALSGKEDTEGLEVAFENEQQTFLSFKAFRQILSMKAAQLQKGKPKEPPVAAAAPSQNGPPVVVK